MKCCGTNYNNNNDNNNTHFSIVHNFRGGGSTVSLCHNITYTVT